jgi:hypothetical protein
LSLSSRQWVRCQRIAVSKAAPMQAKASSKPNSRRPPVSVREFRVTASNCIGVQTGRPGRAEKVEPGTTAQRTENVKSLHLKGHLPIDEKAFGHGSRPVHSVTFRSVGAGHPTKRNPRIAMRYRCAANSFHPGARARRESDCGRNMGHVTLACPVPLVQVATPFPNIILLC